MQDMYGERESNKNENWAIQEILFTLLVQTSETFREREQEEWKQVKLRDASIRSKDTNARKNTESYKIMTSSVHTSETYSEWHIKWKKNWNSRIAFGF